MPAIWKKDFWPQTFDDWRPIPRAIVAMYGYGMWQVMQWFMSLPDPNGSQAAFASTVIVGGAAGVFGFYVHSKPIGKENDSARN